MIKIKYIFRELKKIKWIDYTLNDFSGSAKSSGGLGVWGKLVVSGFKKLETNKQLNSFHFYCNNEIIKMNWIEWTQNEFLPELRLMAFEPEILTVKYENLFHSNCKCLHSKQTISKYFSINIWLMN